MLWRNVQRPVLSDLPEDILLEIAGHLDVEDVFNLKLTNKRFNAFAMSRHLWLQFAQALCGRLPLAIPPLRPFSSIGTEEYQSIIKRALRLENNWRSESPAPRRPPRYLDLTSKENFVMMLRILPGGRLFLLITADGRLTCRETHFGHVVGEWLHGGHKVHSIDVDVVDGGNAMLLAASVDRSRGPHKPGENPILTHTVHVLRIDVSENTETGLPVVNFVHIMASPGDSPWWIVSVEGDIIAAYACELGTKPLSNFAVWVANWRTTTAAIVHLPETVIRLENWPTLQVVGTYILIHEERGRCPASLVFPVPDAFFSADIAETLPHVKITPTLIQDGDNKDNAFQTRFSKLWRNDRVSVKGRPLSLLSISTSVTPEDKRIVTVKTFDPFPACASHFSNPTSPPSITQTKAWSREALFPEARDGLCFTFCLGRYGSFPIWVEEDGPPAELPEGVEYIPELRLMGLFNDYKNGGSRHAKRMAPPAGVHLHMLQCLDFDDAEGILCAVTETGVWLIDY